MKNFIAFCFLGVTMLFLQACVCNTIPPARINWQNDPGKIQRINVNPQSPAAKM